MRILFLTHRLPYPPNKGDKIRSFNILEYLAKHHEVSLACLVDDAADLQYVPDVQARAQRVLFERIDGRSKLLAAAKGVVQGASITVQHFYSAALSRRIDALLDEHDIDAFFCFSSPMAEYLFRSRHANGRIAKALRLMDFIDVDSYKWRQYAERTLPPRRWIYQYEAMRLADYERRIVREFNQLFLVSDQEKQYLPDGVPTERVHALSNGVDLHYFAPAESAAAPVPTLVFTGVMDYWPNVQGVQWFVEHVFDRIRHSVPAARFLIVGSKPTEAVLRLAKLPGIEVTGFVEDVRHFVGPAHVCVVPLKIARGLQNKVLEAMAMGKAVVSTPEALEGIRAEMGADLLVAADADAFATAVVALLLNPARAAQIGKRARQCVERQYSWDANLTTLGELLTPEVAR